MTKPRFIPELSDVYEATKKIKKIKKERKMFVLYCISEQALLMAIEDFNVNFGRNLISKSSYRANGDVFEISVNSIVMENFRMFVLGRKCYREYFRISVEQEDIRGFKSESVAMKAMEDFNRTKADYYIDTSCGTERIKCFEGSIFVPNIQQRELEKIFWEFVSSNEYLKKHIRIGREKHKRLRYSFKSPILS